MLVENWKDVKYSIVLNYDYAPDLFGMITEAINAGDIETDEEIFDYIDEYITDEDEMTLGYFNLQHKIEDRDFAIKTLKEYIGG